MNAELDGVFNAMAVGAVPALWSAQAYPTLKPLASFVTDLLARLKVFSDWCARRCCAVTRACHVAAPLGPLAGSSAIVHKVNEPVCSTMAPSAFLHKICLVRTCLRVSSRPRDPSPAESQTLHSSGHNATWKIFAGMSMAHL